MYQAICDIVYGYLRIPFVNVPIYYDITPLGFVISSLIITIAVLKFRFLDIKQIALKKIYDTLKEAIVVIDSYDRIDDYNNSFAELFPGYKRNDAAGKFYAYLRDISEQEPQQNTILPDIENTTGNCSSGNLLIKMPSRRFMLVNIQPVILKGKDNIGKAISFTDITEYNELINSVRNKNRELSVLNEELKEANLKLTKLNSIAEELAMMKERNRFAREIHDTLGHSMTVLITLLKIINIKINTDPDDVKLKLEQALLTATDGLKELRRSVKGLTSNKNYADSLITSLENLFRDFEKSEVNINFSVDGSCQYEDNLQAEAIYRICQEALTNALRHGSAKNIYITLRYDESIAKLLIIDDGAGCSDLKEGFGLTAMQERVRGLKGTLRFGSEGGSGFNIYVELPLRNLG